MTNRENMISIHPLHMPNGTPVNDFTVEVDQIHHTFLYRGNTALCGAGMVNTESEWVTGVKELDRIGLYAVNLFLLGHAFATYEHINDSRAYGMEGKWADAFKTGLVKEFVVSEEA